VVVCGDGGDIVLRVAGELDVATEPILTEALAAVRTARHHRVVVDLARVTFMDCHGLSALLLARRRGPVLVVGATGVVALVLDVTGARDAMVPVDA
jgi:anti-sigma B factor antagonist